MFVDAICRICIHHVECRAYRLGRCAVQDEVFNQIMSVQNPPPQSVVEVATTTMRNATTAWYASAYILHHNLHLSIGEIAHLLGKSKSATYTALHRATELLVYDNNFRTRLLCAYRKINLLP